MEILPLPLSTREQQAMIQTNCSKFKMLHRIVMFQNAALCSVRMEIVNIYDFSLAREREITQFSEKWKFFPCVRTNIIFLALS